MLSKLLPKLLNELKNHEIYPFFWNLSKNTPTEIKFLDLKTLQAHLNQNAINEPELENLLYGKPKQKYFSGWTESIFNKIAADCKVEVLNLHKDKTFFTIAKVIRKPSSNIDLLSFYNQRLYEKTWEQRKNLRKKVKETKAFCRSLLKKPIDSKNLSNKVWFNLGAGDEAYLNYIKIDLQGEQDIFDNITTLKKIPNQIAERIYTNHVLEHIPIPLIEPMLKRWKEILKPGGKIFARIPNAKASILTLNQEWKEASKEEVKIKDLPPYLDKEASLQGTLDDISCIQAIYGWSSSTKHIWNNSNQHKSLWTPTLARKHFEQAGFKVTEASPFGTLQTLLIAQK